MNHIEQPVLGGRISFPVTLIFWFFGFSCHSISFGLLLMLRCRSDHAFCAIFHEAFHPFVEFFIFGTLRSILSRGS
jgi:hypothetical protein